MPAGFRTCIFHIYVFSCKRRDARNNAINIIENTTQKNELRMALYEPKLPPKAKKLMVLVINKFIYLSLRMESHSLSHFSLVI